MRCHRTKMSLGKYLTIKESVDELRFFRTILIKMYIACDPTTRLLNRILLSTLDFGDNIPKESDLEVID